MLKSWTHDITLALQARSGATPGLFVWLAIVAVASADGLRIPLCCRLRPAGAGIGKCLRRPGDGRHFCADRGDRHHRCRHVAPPRQGSRHPRTRRARAGALVVAARPENSRCRHRKPAARSAGNASCQLRCWLLWPRNGCASIVGAHPRTRPSAAARSAEKRRRRA